MSLEPFIEHLKSLPFVRGARLITRAGTARLVLRTPTASFDAALETFGSHLGRSVAARIAASKEPAGLRFVFAPHVGRPIAELLQSGGVNFVDLAGNCFVDLDGRYIARVQGQPPAKRSVAGEWRAPGYQALFALLARPELLGGTVRELASVAGVSRQAASDALKRVVDANWAVSVGEGRNRQLHWSAGFRRAAVDALATGYERILRPKLLLGTFRSPDKQPVDFEQRVGATLRRAGGVWGGAAAADRMLGYYRGLHSVVHLPALPNQLRSDLRLVPENTGAVSVVKPPANVGEVSDELAPPLLVYLELLCEQSARAHDAANLVWETYLAEGAKA